MQTTTPTTKEILALQLNMPIPQTKIEEIEQACLALMGDKNIRPIDNPDIYCAKFRLANEPTPIFRGACATSLQKITAILAIDILAQYPEIPLPHCESLNA